MATPDPVELCERADELTRAGRLGEAIPLVEEAIPLLVDRDGEHDKKVLDAMRELGSLYVETGNFVGARATYERYLALCEVACEDDAPRLGGAHHYLAELFRAMRDHTRARLHAEKCLAMWEKKYAKDTPDELFVASALNNLAAIEARLGELPRAAELYSRALEIEERLGGKDNPALAPLLNNYANVLITQDEFDKAGAMLERALDLVKTAYGPDHADASLIHHTMGHLALSQGNLLIAELHLRRALVIEDAIPGKEPPTKAALLGYLGEVCRERGANEEAARYLRRALTIYENSYGEEHPKVQQMRDALAKIAPDEGL